VSGGSFFERIEELREMVGDGDLTGTLTADTPYAYNQHEKHWLNFMGRYGYKPILEYHNGGGEKFIEAPLMENYPRYFQNLADAVLDGSLIGAMHENVEDMNRELQQNAPVKTGRLRNSGSTSVTDGGSPA
jgi:hypothetical protein